MLRPGDLLITTGWDRYAWIGVPGGARYEQILLMELALQSTGSPGGLEALPARIASQIAGGGRVIVARVFDRDREARPWEQIAKLGWSRRQLQELLSGFRAREIGRVDGVVFRELTVER